MHGTSGFEEVRASTADHHPIASRTSSGINLEQAPGNFTVLTISSHSPQASIQTEKRFMTPFPGLSMRYMSTSTRLNAKVSSEWVLQTLSPLVHVSVVCLR